MMSQSGECPEGCSRAVAFLLRKPSVGLRGLAGCVTGECE